MKRHWRKALIAAAIFAGFFFMVGFFRSYHLPRLKQWAAVEIEKFSRKNLPVRLWPRRISLTFIPLGVTFHDVKITPQKGAERVLGPFELREAQVSLSLWGLVKGQLRVGDVTLAGADVNVRLPQDNKSESPQKIPLEILRQVPVDRLNVHGVKVKVEAPEQGFVIVAPQLRLRLDNNGDSLRVGFVSDALAFEQTRDNIRAELDLSTQFLLDREGIYFSAIRVKKENSYLLATGALTGDLPNLRWDRVRADVRSRVRWPDVTLILRDIFGRKVPALAGASYVEVGLDHWLNDNAPKAEVKFSGQGLAIDKFGIGDLEFHAVVDNEKARFSNLRLYSQAGQVQILKGEIGVQEPFAFTGEAKINKLDIHHLLDQLSIDNVPVFTEINGALPCEGRIAPPFSVICKGAMEDSKVKVTAGMNGALIVDLEKVGASGEVRVDAAKVQYTAKVSVGGSRGSSTGTVIYKKGFQIIYDSPALDFKDVKNLGNLDLKGVVELQGKTQGDSSAATFGMRLHAKNASLENFKLGDFRTELNYKQGSLSFRDVAGRYNQSQYNGQLVLNFNKDTYDLDVKAPFVALEDVQEALAQRVPIPLPLEGTGSATMKACGPFQLNRITFNFTSAFFRGTVAGETFDQAQIELTANEGHLQTRKAIMTKAGSNVALIGSLDPQGRVKAEITTRNVRLEQSEYLSRMKLNIAGALNMSAQLTGKILRPRIEANGILSNVMIGAHPAPESHFKFTLDEKSVAFDGNFAGGAVVAKGLIPFAANEPYNFEMKTDNWNFSRLFLVVDENYRATAFTTTLTSDLKLSGSARTMTATNGQLRVDHLLVRNGPATLESKEPLQITLNKGVLNVKPWQIAGDAGILKLSSRETRPHQMDVSLDGKIDLLMFSVFTPFLDDLRGQLTMNLNLNGPLTSPDLLGSSFLQEGLVRLKGFPHALEQASADILFSKKRVLINSAKARLAGGVVSASGRVQFNALTDLVIDIRGQFQDSVFNVPEGFTTRGSGDFFVTGSWFPYTFGMNFRVDSGSIEKKFTPAVRSTKEVKPSIYLPRFLVEKRFSPVNLDLNVSLRNPITVAMQVPQLEVKARATGAVQAKGPPEQIRLTGRVDVVRGSQFVLRGNTFEVSSGFVEYKNSPPENPELNIIAESRVTAQMPDEEQREYEVVARVNGTVSKPLIHMTSQPPLPEKDLISLLTLGFIHESNRREQPDGLTGKATSAGYQMGSAFLTEQLGINKQLQKTFGVEFDYSSSFDTTDQAHEHTFILRKQWTPKFGTSASRTIGKSNTNNVKAEYKLNRNLSVIGRWEGREQTGATDNSERSEQNQFGLDVEYRVKFK